jgi:hypothetical protein
LIFGEEFSRRNFRGGIFEEGGEWREEGEMLLMLKQAQKTILPPPSTLLPSRKSLPGKLPSI